MDRDEPDSIEDTRRMTRRRRRRSRRAGVFGGGGGCSKMSGVWVHVSVTAGLDVS